MCWRSASLTACSCALLAAGCGGSGRHDGSTAQVPRIPAGVAARLAADADRVASTPGCGARSAATTFRSDVIAVIGRLPARYQEPLTSAANDLVDRIPPCPQPAEKEEREGGHGHGKHKRNKGHR
jgi:hypothetical protein